jgi:hypothetical protein
LVVYWKSDAAEELVAGGLGLLGPGSAGGWEGMVCGGDAGNSDGPKSRAMVLGSGTVSGGGASKELRVPEANGRVVGSSSAGKRAVVPRPTVPRTPSKVLGKKIDSNWRISSTTVLPALRGWGRRQAALPLSNRSLKTFKQRRKPDINCRNILVGNFIGHLAKRSLLVAKPGA